MLRDIERHLQRASTVTVAGSWFVVIAFATLGLGELASRTGKRDIDDMSLTELQVALVYNRLTIYWTFIALLLNLTGGMLVAWGMIESRAARTKAKRLTTISTGATTSSLREVEDLLESAKIEATNRRVEVEALEARIAAAEQLKDKADVELDRVGEALGLSQLTRETERSSRLQLWLAVAGLVLTVATTVAALL